MAPDSPLIRLGGYDVSVADTGPGSDPVVLVHGLGVSRRYFGPLQRVLAADRRVVAPDLPGFGRSPAPGAALSIEEHATVLEELLVRRGIERPVLIGHSLGAQVVTEVAARNPGLAARIVLIGPVVEPGTRSAVRQAWRLVRDTRFETVSTNAIMMTDWLRCGLPQYLATVPSMIAYRLEDRLAGVTAPVVLVRGEHDPVAPIDYLERLALRVAQADVVEVPHEGHVVMYRSPERVARLCDGVLC